MPDHGPYDTRAQAHAAAVASAEPGPGWSVLHHAQNLQLLHDALQDAGVVAGAYDSLIAEWLANYEDATVAVVAGWIRRAAQPPEGTVTEWGVRFDGPPPFHGELSAYDTEAEARHQAAITPTKVSGWSATVMSRPVGSWTEAPEEDGEDGQPA